VGRFQNGGASDVGWATSTDNGRTWSHGLLPKLTVNSTPPGPYKRATDPSVAYDAKHGQWLAGVLDSRANGFFNGDNISVSRSADGLTWGNPVNVATASGSSSFDSTWVACDNTSSSPHYGNCYFAWDDFGLGAPLRVSVSSDGGLTWTPSSTPGVGVIGSKPVPQPNGNVVLVAGSNPLGVLESFVSKDGGA